jgi:hypothetical protein
MPLFSRVVLTVLALALGATAARAQEGAGSVEYPVKAAFLYNFMRYVEWPERPAAEMTVCILGQDPFGPAIDRALVGKAVGGRPVTVRRMATASTSPACAVLFVPASAMRDWAAARTRLGGEPVLTVGETRGFTDAGGVIGFVVEANRLQFEVNQSAADAARLRLSSRLLGLAHAVRRTAQ